MTEFHKLLDQIFPEIAKEQEELTANAPAKRQKKTEYDPLRKCRDCGHKLGNHDNKGEGHCKVHRCTCDPLRVNNKLRVKK